MALAFLDKDDIIVFMAEREPQITQPKRREEGYWIIRTAETDHEKRMAAMATATESLQHKLKGGDRKGASRLVHRMERHYLNQALADPGRGEFRIDCDPIEGLFSGYANLSYKPVGDRTPEDRIRIAEANGEKGMTYLDRFHREEALKEIAERDQ